ncbi:MAG: hypothetical protein AB1807_03285 [Pseudomonadota bacterium]
MQFAIAPVGNGVFWSMAAITVLACAAPLLVIRRDGLAVSMKNVLMTAVLILPFTMTLAYSVHDNTLHVEGGKILLRAAHFYEHDRPLSDFNLDAARAGSYNAIPEAHLGTRRNGIGMPGYSAGRFKGAGDGLVFAVLTDRSQVVYLPAKVGPSLLVSVEQPEQFLAAVRGAAAIGRR